MVNIARNFLIMLNNLLKSTETSSKRVTGDLIGNKIADKITGVSKHLQ